MDMNGLRPTMLLVMFLAVATGQAQEGSRGQQPAGPNVQMSLDQAVVWGLQNNLDIEVQSYLPSLREAAIEQQRAVFDPSFGSTFTAQRTETDGARATVGTGRLRTESYDWSTTLGRTMQTGGSIQMALSGNNSVTNQRFSIAQIPLPGAILPAPTFSIQSPTTQRTWRHTASVTLTQPLLRNFGFEFNRSGIRIAENSKEQSYYTYQQQVLDTVQQIVTAYWSAYLAAETLKIQLESLDRVRTSMELTRLLVQEGKLAKHEIFEVETNLANQLEAVHSSQKAYLDAEDVLKQLIAPENFDFIWGSHLELTTRPTVAGPTRPAEESARTALELRPEIHSQRVGLKNSDEAILQARNALLPQLDFSGTASLTDALTHSNYANSVDAAWSGNFDSGFSWTWQVGLSLTIPIGNRAARSAYTQRLIERRQAEAGLRNLESQIVNQVREAVRDVDTTFRRVDVTSRGAEAALKRYDSEVILFREGQTDNFRLQNFRATLLAAQLQELNARLQHAISHIDLERSEGTILRRLRDRQILIPGVNQ